VVADHVRAWTAALVLVFMVLALFVTARANCAGGTSRDAAGRCFAALNRKGTS